MWLKKRSSLHSKYCLIRQHFDSQDLGQVFYLSVCCFRPPTVPNWGWMCTPPTLVALVFTMWPVDMCFFFWRYNVYSPAARSFLAVGKVTSFIKKSWREGVFVQFDMCCVFMINLLVLISCGWSAVDIIFCQRGYVFVFGLFVCCCSFSNPYLTNVSGI